MEIQEIRIHPAIGIARVGTSASDYFIGPEERGEVGEPPGGHRDGQGRIKREAARFRLFAYGAGGQCLGEITAENGEIEWTVELVNKKASAKKFTAPQEDRNKNVQGAARQKLEIRPGAKSLKGRDRSAVLSGKIEFPGHPQTAVVLGEMRTDQRGRLLVLGGAGRNGRLGGPPPNQLHFADNDGWYDDLADGRVAATVKLKGSEQTIPALGAWVIVAPAKFAPAIDHAITLHDRLFQLACEKGWRKIPEKVSLRDEVYPILHRPGLIGWVRATAFSRHAWHEAYPLGLTDRTKIFNRLRPPQGGGGAQQTMPRLQGPSVVPLTPVQYEMMRKWVKDEVVKDLADPRPLPTPEDLDRAVLDACAGAAFYPGIEAGSFLLDPNLYLQPFSFRLDPAKVAPGDVTARMAIPWQADFLACGNDWWPVNRPNQVRPESQPDTSIEWNRGPSLITEWHTRGFVVRRGEQLLEVGGPPVDAPPEAAEALQEEKLAQLDPALV